MKKVLFIIMIIATISSIVTSCASTKGHGCPATRGKIGY